MIHHKDHDHSLTLQGYTKSHLLLIVTTLLLMGNTIYLTMHFFKMHFSMDLSNAGVLCHISEYWSCDTATFSPLSHLFNVPISVLGFLFAGQLLVGSLFPSEFQERTNRWWSLINVVMCFFLLGYSLFILKSLCPLCTLYYFLSLIVAILFLKHAPRRGGLLRPAPKVVLYQFLVAMVVCGGFSFYVTKEQNEKESISKNLMDQFHNLPKVADPMGLPDSGVPGKIYFSTVNFSDAPLRLSIFSDFECPACKLLSEELPKVIKRYAGKINIQYFFYPLDNACNKKITTPFHQYACLSSYLGVCGKESFAKLHDEIFKNQQELSRDWIERIAKRLDKEACIQDFSTKDLVEKSIAWGDELGVSATPTLILNGTKLNFIPVSYLFLLFDKILLEAK